jgi:hypothetical protein
MPTQMQVVSGKNKSVPRIRDEIDPDKINVILIIDIVAQV